MSAVQGSAEFMEVNGWPLRMRLDRWWSDEPRALVVMCNPSDAGAENNDPTIWSLIALIRALPGVGGFTAVNFEPYIATDPADLHRWRDGAAWNQPDAYRQVRQANLALIRELSGRAAIRIVAWGNMVPKVPHATAVLMAMSLDLAHPLHAFGLTNDGAPKHPLARGKHRIVPGSGLTIWRDRVVAEGGQP